MKITEAIRAQTAYGAYAITPHDTNDNAFDGIYVGGTGDLAVEMRDGSSATFVSVSNGFLPIVVNKVKSTGTSATSLLGLKKA